MREADIMISGVLLDTAASMTVRVAIESFARTLEEGLGDDAQGQRTANLYKQRIGEIRALIARTAR